MRPRPARMIDALRDEWNDLADRVDAPPWLRPGWITAWWQAFGRGSLQLLTSTDGGKLRALLPVYRRAGCVSATSNSESPGYGALADSADARADVQQQLFAMGAHWITLFPMTRKVLRCEWWAETAAAAGYDHLERNLRRSPYIDLDGEWDDYERRLDRKLRTEIRRRTKRLEELGALLLDVDDGGTALDASIDEIFELEEKGWKGARRTAIASRQDATVFYRRLAASEQKRGTLRITRLLLDSRMLAFDLSLEERGRHFLLKTSFDDDFARYGPGILLRYKALRDCFDRGLKRYEFLGRDDAWKLRWTSDAHDIDLFRAFSPSVLGRARAAEGRLRPLLRRRHAENGERRT